MNRTVRGSDALRRVLLSGLALIAPPVCAQQPDPAAAEWRTEKVADGIHMLSTPVGGIVGCVSLLKQA